MASRPLAAALAISLLLLGSASAADVTAKTSPSPVTPVTPAAPKLTAAERCASLEEQFNAALLLHLTAKKIALAKKLAEEGTEQCTKKKYSLGSRRLVAALTDLGVTAKL